MLVEGDIGYVGECVSMYKACSMKGFWNLIRIIGAWNKITVTP